MLQGKILVCYVAAVLLQLDLFSSTEMCASLFRNNENESSLAYTDILHRLYKARIQELNSPCERC